MSNAFLLVLLAFLGNYTFTGLKTPPVKEEIIWSGDRRLSWDDFKGIPTGKGITGAITYSTIKAVPKVTGFWNDRVEVEVRAIFRCDKSWAVDKARESEYLLNHEQRHFDIAELYARKIRAELENHRITPGNYARIKVEVIERLFQEYVDFDEAYDHQTVHGINRSSQEEWNEEIDQELGMVGMITVDDN